MNTKDVVNNLINPDYLSNVMGTDVSPTNVRIKPDTSVVAGFVDEQEQHGWVRVLWPGSAGKAHKTASQAGKMGLSTTELDIAGGMVLQYGSALADPKMLKHIHEAGISPHSRVLRYNPQRRLVVRNGDNVTRITERAAAFSIKTYEHIAEHVSVPARLDSGCQLHCSELEFLGKGDLTDAHAQEDFSFAAGVIAHQLHSASIDRAPDHNPADAHAQVKAHTELMSIMAPEFLSRLQNITQQLPPLDGPSVVLHGDLSPDQYLYGDKLWLTDFDRLHLGPAVKDLGSYLATSSPTAGAEFLRGYGSVANSMPSDDELRIATTHSMVLRIADPLRKARPTWREEIDNNLTQIEEALS